ncbi:hypothetical protein ERJ75_000446200 [Trypanosoma vivax]|uniref:Mucin-associated surface protein (MASP) n=1 Tax=Trypanosoma vivax (strain Y486) TaxID=1055687 RepID=F9WMD8_TRYVY
MAFHFSLALLAAILLNGAVLGDDSTSSGAIAGADGERNAPSCGDDAGRKSEGRARNGDKLVVLDSARTTPSETVRKSVSVVKRVSGQSSLSSRNEARNDHAGVGNELRDQPATSHKAQASADDKHGMKLPRARRPAASRHSEGGLTSTSPKESVEVLDRKKEFENMVSGIIAEDAEVPGVGSLGSVYSEYNNNGNGYYDSPVNNDELQHGVKSSTGPSVGDNVQGIGYSTGGGSPVQNNVSITNPAPDSTPSAVPTPDSNKSSATGNEDGSNTNDGETTEYGQNKKKKEEEEEKKEKEKETGEVRNEKGEKQLGQRSNENSDGRETNNSSDDAENSEAPPQGNSAFLCGSCSSVLLVAVACLCASAC